MDNEDNDEAPAIVMDDNDDNNKDEAPVIVMDDQYRFGTNQKDSWLSRQVDAIVTSTRGQETKYAVGQAVKKYLDNGGTFFAPNGTTIDDDVVAIVYSDELIRLARERVRSQRRRAGTKIFLDERPQEEIDIAEFLVHLSLRDDIDETTHTDWEVPVAGPVPENVLLTHW